MRPRDLNYICRTGMITGDEKQWYVDKNKFINNINLMYCISQSMKHENLKDLTIRMVCHVLNCFYTGFCDESQHLKNYTSILINAYAYNRIDILNHINDCYLHDVDFISVFLVNVDEIFKINNCLNSIKWLHQKFPINKSIFYTSYHLTDILYYTCVYGYKDILLWVLTKYSSIDETINFKFIANLVICSLTNGHINITKLLCAIFNITNENLITNGFKLDEIPKNNLETAKWIHKKFKLSRHINVEITHKHLLEACLDGDAELARWLHSTYITDFRFCLHFYHIFSTICIKGYLDVANFLFDVYNDVIPTNMLVGVEFANMFSVACGRGHLDLAKLFHSKRKIDEYSVAYNLNYIISHVAVYEDKWKDVLDWLFDTFADLKKLYKSLIKDPTGRDPYEDPARIASVVGNFNIVLWIHKNLE